MLDTKRGDWQQRKNYWLSFGIREGGRSHGLNKGLDKLADVEYSTCWSKNKDTNHTGTSIFDPVLCELTYKWFNIPKGKILD